MIRYSTQEVQKLLQISVDTWKRRKEEILIFLSEYWDYSIETVGRAVFYCVHEELSPLPPLPRKTSSNEKKQFYTEQTDKVVQKYPLNTGANITRSILKTDNRYNHSERTGANYVRPILRENYHLSEERVWCQLDYNNNIYKPITPEQESFLKSMFKIYLSDDKTAEIMAAQEAGYITKDEVFDVLHSNYNDAINRFIEKYGFRPLKIGEYTKNAF